MARVGLAVLPGGGGQLLKLLRRKEFLKLKPGTLYASGTPWAFGELHRKGETISSNDWCQSSFNWVDADDSGKATERLEGMLERGESYPMQNSEARDGGFDEDEIFLIFERDDLISLKEHIEWALSLC